MTQSRSHLRLFLCHSSGDKAAVRNLYKRLRTDGFDPWLDEENLLPGHDWHREIARAVREADIVLVCLSRDSINKKGFIQKEIKYALDAADEEPERSIFLIPVKLAECDVPERLNHLHWVNLFEEGGYQKLLASLQVKSGKPVVNTSSEKPAGQLAHKSFNSGKTLLDDLMKWLLIIVCFLGITLAIKQTTLGEHLSLTISDFLTRQLSTHDVPITIVDISGLDSNPTPRKPLSEIIEAISAQNPKAVGVAIDFSPNPNGYIDPDDPSFFQFCTDLRKKTGVPIFLGIYRSIFEPPAAWLGAEKFQDLAANLLMPKDAAGSRRMLSEMQEADERARGRLAAASKPIKSISTTLADSYDVRPDGSSGWLQQLRVHLIDILTRAGFIEKTFERRLAEGVTATEFPVDFSPLDSIETVRTTNPIVLGDQSLRSRFEGKLVLIGDASLVDAREAFAIPRQNKPYPAIFLHACAAYTLINPLYETTTIGRFGIDSFFFLTVILGVTAIRYYYRAQARGKGTFQYVLCSFERSCGCPCPRN